MADEQQFDLICNFGKTPIRYRIDAAIGQACEQDCSRIWKMGPVTSGDMTLMDTTGTPGEVQQTIVINRLTGKLRHWIRGLDGPLTEEATCSAAPFSGFPPAKF
ncbi:hypothetical protein CA234_09735 [Sphingomonas sp. ABOLE]|nr:hypothetical protein CA234_09735 [Sphingomonas sp. ABOLE]